MIVGEQLARNSERRNIRRRFNDYRGPSNVHCFLENERQCIQWRGEDRGKWRSLLFVSRDSIVKGGGRERKKEGKEKRERELGAQESKKKRNTVFEWMEHLAWTLKLDVSIRCSLAWISKLPPT